MAELCGPDMRPGRRCRLAGKSSPGGLGLEHGRESPIFETPMVAVGRSSKAMHGNCKERALGLSMAPGAVSGGARLLSGWVQAGHPWLAAAGPSHLLVWPPASLIPAPRCVHVAGHFRLYPTSFLFLFSLPCFLPPFPLTPGR